MYSVWRPRSQTLHPGAAHLKLDQNTAPSVTQLSPPPYSCTRVRALNLESSPGSTSATVPSGDLRPATPPASRQVHADRAAAHLLL